MGVIRFGFWYRLDGSSAVRAALAASLIVCLGPTTARADTVDLRYVPRAAPHITASEDAACVELRIVDARPEDRGGRDPGRIGVARGMFGRPYPLTSRGQSLTEVMTLWGEDLLAEAGGCVYRGPDVSRPMVVLAVKRFWADGYHRVDGSAGVQVSAHVRAGGDALWTSQEVTAVVDRSRKQSRAFERAFDDLIAKLEAPLRREIARALAVSQAPDAAAVAPLRPW